MVTSKTRLFVEAIRPYNMVGPILAFTIGFFFVSKGQTLGKDYLIGCIEIVLLLAYATLQNDVEDIAIDRVNAPEKAIPSGKLSYKHVSVVNTIILVFILSLSFLSFPAHLPFVILSLLITWAYNKAPLYLSRKPVWSVGVMALMYSVLPIMYGYFVANGVHMSFIFGLFLCAYLVLRISVSILKDYKDAEGDRQYGKRTFYLTYGSQTVAWVSFVFFCLGTVGIFTILGTIRPLSWLLVLPLVLFARNVYLRFGLFRTADTKKLTVIFHKLFFGQNQFDVLFLSCLILLK